MKPWLRRWGAITCALWCLLAAAVIVVRVQAGRAFDTDIQSLLPQDALDPIVRAAMAQAGNAAASRIEILVSAPEPERAAAAGADLERALAATGLFAPVEVDGAEIGAWLFANRDALICEATPAAFDGAGARAQALAMLFAPAAPLSGDLLRRDPFLRTLALAQCLTPSGAGGTAGESVLVSGRLTRSAYRLDVQEQAEQVYDAWRGRWPDAQAARAGALFHAAASARSVRTEVSLIGGIGLVIVVGCLLAAFRRPGALAGALAVTAAGAVGSLGMALLVFPSVHVLVFVFGSALIGVTSDYALHYLATGPLTQWAPAGERLRMVRRPLLICAGTTSLGFAGLCLFDVALFKQVAVFSIAGVLTALWFTLTLLPAMDRRPKHAARLAAWWARLEAPFGRARWPRWAPALGIVAMALVCVIAAARFQVLDDVRRFQALSPQLMAEERAVRAASGFSASPQFLLSHGADAEQARQREEAALAALPEAVRADVLAGSRIDPSQARRAENERVIRERLYAPYLGDWRGMLGLSPEPFAPPPPSAAPRLIADLSGAAANQAFLIAPLGAAALAEAPALPGVRLIDPAERYSAAFAAYRGQALLAFLLAFGLCALAVLALYRTPRALSIMAGPAIGAVLAAAAPAALGLPASFFSVAALFVVIGAGIDHSVFRYEAANSHGGGVDLSVFLSMLTTIASMGLLAMSSAYPARIFGVAVAAGVASAYAFSFIAGRAGAGGRS